MIIKKFLAKSEKAAIEMAKNELGNNAIVMNIKKVKPKGLAKLFVRGKVEVTAALDETPLYSQEEAAKEKRPVEAGKFSEAEKKTDAPDNSSLEERISMLQALLEKQMMQKEGMTEKVEKTLEIPVSEPKENVEPKEVPESKEEDEEDEKTKAYKELIYQQLVQNEVDEEIAKSIMSEENEKTKFIFFLGSTGVGKTTTIAKIASKLKLEKHAKIALVTADTYRIAAVEQLKTYANILSVPLEVIYSPQELGDNLEKLKQYDVCLIDTAGRSHKSKEQMEDIRALLEQIPVNERQVYLVLNAGTKYSDLQKIASVYSALTDFSLIFTKLDETSSAGIMLNMRVKTNCPLSYVTWGQNVPEDIGEMDPQRVAKKLLSDNHTN